MTSRTWEELAEMLATRLKQAEALLKRHVGEFYDGSTTQTLNRQILTEHRQRKTKVTANRTTGLNNE